MARTVDLIGMRYGKLTVVERTDKREKGYCLWRCRCDCGGEILVSTKRLKKGTVTNCGCIPPDSARRGHTAENLTGRRFGKLTAIQRVENKHNRTCWLCQCDCGNQCEVTAHMLKSGRVRSCGCIRGGMAFNVFENCQYNHLPIEALLFVVHKVLQLHVLSPPAWQESVHRHR